MINSSNRVEPFRDVQHIAPTDKSKCREYDCGVLCVNTYKTDYHNKILGMCVNNYNFCQCMSRSAKVHLRQTKPKNTTFEIFDGKPCHPIGCNLACLRNDFNFGICGLDKPICTCWTSMNFPRGIGLRASSWFGIINLEINFRSLYLTDKYHYTEKLRYLRK